MMRFSVLIALAFCMHISTTRTERPRTATVVDELELFMQQFPGVKLPLTGPTVVAPTIPAPAASAPEILNAPNPRPAIPIPATPAPEALRPSSGQGSAFFNSRPGEPIVRPDHNPSMTIQFDMNFFLEKLLGMKLPKMTFEVPTNGVDILMDGTKAQHSGYVPSEQQVAPIAAGNNNLNLSSNADCPENECLKFCDNDYASIYDENKCIIGCECIPWKCVNFACPLKHACPAGQFLQSDDMGCQENCKCETPSPDCLDVTCQKECPYGYTLMRDSEGCLLHSCVCNVCPTLTCEPCARGFRYEADGQGCQKSCKCVEDPCNQSHQLACERTKCSYQAILRRDAEGCYDEKCSCTFANHILANYDPKGDGYMGTCPTCGKRELDDNHKRGFLHRGGNVAKEDARSYVYNNEDSVAPKRREENEEELERRLVQALKSALADA